MVMIGVTLLLSLPYTILSRDEARQVLYGRGPHSLADTCLCSSEQSLLMLQVSHEAQP